MSTAIVWFRRDLRLADNPALQAGVGGFDRIVPVYIHAPEEEGESASCNVGSRLTPILHHAEAVLPGCRSGVSRERSGQHR